jgi:hypothetical protein
MKLILHFLILLLAPPFVWSSNLSAQNAGFEGGSISGWTASGGDVTVSTGVNNVSYGGGKTWTVKPYGSYMAQLYPSGSVQFNAATTALGLSTAENTAIRNYLTYQSQNGGSGDPTPTNASWIKKEVTLQAGTTYSFSWNYLSTDYTPYNDGSMMTLTHSTNSGVVATLNNSQQRYALLGFTNTGTGNYATGSYGSTGWQLATITVPVSGTYVLGFSTFNLGDTALSPILFIDEMQGSTTLNGATFAPIAPNAGSTAPSTPPPAPPGPTYCCGASDTSFSVPAPKSSLIQNFNNRTSQDSKVNIEQIGSYNTTTVQQTGTKNSYVNYYTSGNSNTTEISQSATSMSQTNYVDLKVTGSYNQTTISQQNSGGSKTAFVTVNDNNNILNLTQTGTGNHYLDVNVSGGSKSVTTLQQGSGNHMTSITLTGLPVSINTIQSGSTQQFYSINYNCATAGGCAPITVTQGQ